MSFADCFDSQLFHSSSLLQKIYCTVEKRTKVTAEMMAKSDNTKIQIFNLQKLENLYQSMESLNYENKEIHAATSK